MILRTTTCRDCGATGKDTHAGPNYRCFVCTQRFVERLRDWAKEGLMQKEMAQRLGLSQNAVAQWCTRYEVLTSKSRKDTDGRKAVLRDRPAGLSPSAKALKLNCVWGLAK